MRRGNLNGPSQSDDKSDVDELTKRVKALEDQAKAAEAARDEAEQRASEAEATVKELSMRLANVEAAEDPLPDEFNDAEAANIVDRLLGISKIDMSDDVEALLWAHAMRRLGVLTFREYERRKKRLLARDIDLVPSPIIPRADGGKAEPAAGAKPGAATEQTEKGLKK